MAGGALPEGVSSITYAFPDGHQKRATIKDGFWVMQYFSEDPFVEPGTPLGDPIEVIVDGSGGRHELTMDWTEENMWQPGRHAADSYGDTSGAPRRIGSIGSAGHCWGAVRPVFAGVNAMKLQPVLRRAGIAASVWPPGCSRTGRIRFGTSGGDVRMNRSSSWRAHRVSPKIRHPRSPSR